MKLFPIDLASVPSPCWVVDEVAIERNLRILDDVQQRTGCKIILALKGFAMFSLFPLMRRYLRGTTASSPNEARLGAEEFGGEVHIYAPAYRDEDFADVLRWADHISFNSFGQWRHFRERVRQAGKPIECAIRINPQHSEVPVAIYDPCAPGSRLGVPLDQFEPDELDGIAGIHFHTLCESDVEPLERTMAVVEEKFGAWLGRMKWLNLGGGHHITRPDYDVDRLCALIERVRQTYDVQVYLEPGEACAIRTGILVATVLDIVHNGMPIAIVDTSVSCHMPDCLEMPYKPEIDGAGEPGELAHTYRLGGMTCLAGDVIGDYSFAEPLRPGQRLAFMDMAHYTMVKTTTFNGVHLPSIAIANSVEKTTRVVRQFGYEDYRCRLS